MAPERTPLLKAATPKDGRTTPRTYGGADLIRFFVLGLAVLFLILLALHMMGVFMP